MQFDLSDGKVFDTENPVCPQCNGAMWDNRQSKKTPKQPDFRCKDANCKSAKGFTTGVYLPKGKKSDPAPAVSVPQSVSAPAPRLPASSGSSYNKKDYGNSVPPSMYGAWAMNVVIALVEQGGIKTLDEALKQYDVSLARVGESIQKHKSKLDITGPVPVEQQVREVNVKPVAPSAVVSPETSVLPDPLESVVSDLSAASPEIQLDSLSNLDF